MARLVVMKVDAAQGLEDRENVASETVKRFRVARTIAAFAWRPEAWRKAKAEDYQNIYINECDC